MVFVGDKDNNNEDGDKEEDEKTFCFCYHDIYSLLAHTFCIYLTIYLLSNYLSTFLTVETKVTP